MENLSFTYEDVCSLSVSSVFIVELLLMVINSWPWTLGEENRVKSFIAASNINGFDHFFFSCVAVGMNTLLKVCVSVVF